MIKISLAKNYYMNQKKKTFFVAIYIILMYFTGIFGKMKTWKQK